MTQHPLLQVSDITKTYGGRIGCADVSFDLWPGEVMGIVGESGSGKSTLLSCMAGHLAPDTGRVVFDTRAEGPRDVLAMNEPERRMLARTDWAFVHQNPRDGLRMGVSAGGNVGERLARGTMGLSANRRSTGWAGSRSRPTGSTTGRVSFPGACSNAFRSPATS
jgi:putative phosphonate transport system ATP-binding protein